MSDSTQPATYRARTNEVEAVRLTFDAADAARAFVTAPNQINFMSDGRFVLRIETVDGVKVARDGDYIIRAASGDYYICGPAVFEANYEIIEKRTEVEG